VLCCYPGVKHYDLNQSFGVLAATAVTVGLSTGTDMASLIELGWVSWVFCSVISKETT
jgi:hypothetical protein